MKQADLSDLVALPDKNQQELERLLAAYRWRLTELANHAKAIRAQVAKPPANQNPIGYGNPDKAPPRGC